MKDVKIVTPKDVMDSLQLLIEKYKFNVDVLSKLLDVRKEVILSKDEKKLFENSKDFSKTMSGVGKFNLLKWYSKEDLKNIK